MPRNLDLTALRSFAAVADAGGVTRAAAQLNLTPVSYTHLTLPTTSRV